MVAKYTAKNASITIFSAELNALANDANKITSAPISNSLVAERDLFSMFRLHLELQGAARKANASISMFFLPEEGGSHAYGSDVLDPAPEHLAHVFNFDANTSARDAVTPLPIVLPNSNYHILLINETGQALAATNNTLTYEVSDGGYEDV